MKLTSAEAAKLLRKLNDDKNLLLQEEQAMATFNATLDEKLETVRPDYDYEETQKKLADLDKKIVNLKHAISTFNLTHEVPGTGMTVDQVLVYIPQLSARKDKLCFMAMRLQKERVNVLNFGRTSTIIDYTYANYDVKKAKADYEAVFAELTKTQTALDVLNTTETMEVEL